jgi:hypothetical protein
MEMMINLFAIGFSLPGAGIGINGTTNCYVGFRHSKKNPDILLGLQDVASMGPKSGTILGSWIVTDYFNVEYPNHRWIANTGRLIGKTVEIEVSGTMIVRGTVDIRFTVIDKNGNFNQLLSKANINATGGQLANTKIRGKFGQIL